MTDVERDHLFRVAGAAIPSAGHVPTHVTPTAQRMVDRFRNAPVAGAVHTAIYELVLWNPLWAALFGDPSSQTRLERNVAWRYFEGSIPVTHLRAVVGDRVVVGGLDVTGNGLGCARGADDGLPEGATSGDIAYGRRGEACHRGPALRRSRGRRRRT